jgi:glyoxylase I family protein
MDLRFPAPFPSSHSLPSSRLGLSRSGSPRDHATRLTGKPCSGCMASPDLASTEPFNERTPGLDHIAFGVASRDELAELAAQYDELGVAHGDIVDASYGSGVSFRDPDNIALELLAPPA